MKQMSYSRSLAVEDGWDVIVCGSGPSGHLRGGQRGPAGPENAAAGALRRFGRQSDAGQCDDYYG